MNRLFSKTPLIAVVGPTASGKSDLGIALAERFDGEIVKRAVKSNTQLFRFRVLRDVQLVVVISQSDLEISQPS